MFAVLGSNGGFPLTSRRQGPAPGAVTHSGGTPAPPRMHRFGKTRVLMTFHGGRAHLSRTLIARGPYSDDAGLQKPSSMCRERQWIFGNTLFCTSMPIANSGN